MAQQGTEEKSGSTEDEGSAQGSSAEQNTGRHAATDEAELVLEHREGTVSLTVNDRGRGLVGERADGTGVRGMRERATLVGGRLTLESDGAAGGCRVHLVVPAEPEL